MKTLVTFAFFLFLCGTVESQIYTPLSPSIYGQTFNRIKAAQVLHIPSFNDTLLRTNDTSAQIRVMNGQLTYYTGGSWKQVTGATGVGSGFNGITTVGDTIGTVFLKGLGTPFSPVSVRNAQPVLNVLDFGAHKNDTTDSYPAFIATINAAKIFGGISDILIPDGDFYFGKGLVVDGTSDQVPNNPNHPISIKGTGKRGSFLHFTNSTDSFCIKFGNTNRNTLQSYIGNLSIIGDSTKDGIVISSHAPYAAAWNNIEDLYLTNIRDGITNDLDATNTTSNFSNHFKNIQVENYYRYGFDINGVYSTYEGLFATGAGGKNDNGYRSAGDNRGTRTLGLNIRGGSNVITGVQCEDQVNIEGSFNIINGLAIETIRKNAANPTVGATGIRISGKGNTINNLVMSDFKPSTISYIGSIFGDNTTIQNAQYINSGYEGDNTISYPLLPNSGNGSSGVMINCDIPTSFGLDNPALGTFNWDFLNVRGGSGFFTKVRGQGAGNVISNINGTTNKLAKYGATAKEITESSIEDNNSNVSIHKRTVTNQQDVNAGFTVMKGTNGLNPFIDATDNDSTGLVSNAIHIKLQAITGFGGSVGTWSNHRTNIVSNNNVGIVVNPDRTTEFDSTININYAGTPVAQIIQGHTDFNNGWIALKYKENGIFKTGLESTPSGIRLPSVLPNTNNSRKILVYDDTDKVIKYTDNITDTNSVKTIIQQQFDSTAFTLRNSLGTGIKPFAFVGNATAIAKSFIFNSADVTGNDTAVMVTPHLDYKEVADFNSMTPTTIPTMFRVVTDVNNSNNNGLYFTAGGTDNLHRIATESFEFNSAVNWVVYNTTNVSSWTESPAHTWWEPNGNAGYGVSNTTFSLGTEKEYTAEYGGTENQIATIGLSSTNTLENWFTFDYYFQVNDAGNFNAVSQSGEYSNTVAAQTGDRYGFKLHSDGGVEAGYYRSGTWNSLITFSTHFTSDIIYLKGASGYSGGVIRKILNPQYK